MNKPDVITQRGQAGLCASCVWVRVVESARGSVFFLCGLSRQDPTFPKYPRLPVVSCRGFEARAADLETDDP